MQYVYVLAAALDIGTAMSAIFIFVALGLSGASLNWWGNTVYQKSESPRYRRSDMCSMLAALDWVGSGSALLTAPPGGFGPDTWAV